MVILEEGNLSHPWCPRCDMLLLWASLNSRYPNTALCAKGVEKKESRLTAEKVWDFWEYGQPLTLVSSSKYIGRVLTALDNDWLVVVGNLSKARTKWPRLSRILVWEGGNRGW